MGGWSVDVRSTNEWRGIVKVAQWRVCGYRRVGEYVEGLGPIGNHGREHSCWFMAATASLGVGTLAGARYHWRAWA
jgi:hypothetical protein